MQAIFIKKPLNSKIYNDTFYHSFETDPARRVDPGLEPGWVEEKIEKEKTRCDLVDPVRPSCNPLTFVFFFLLRQCHFDIKKFNSNNPVI
jgi:hypothetical protein